jgi:hypothetical protein
LADGTLFLTRVSGRADGALAEDHSFVGRFSPDGRYLAFDSYSSDVLGDFNRGPGQILLADTAVPGVGVRARRAEEGPWRGADGVGQPVSVLPPIAMVAGVGDTAPARYAILLLNTGSVPEALRISALRPVSGFSRIGIEALTAPRQDITEAVFGEGWTTPILPPGESLRLEVALGLVVDPVTDGTLDLRVSWGPTGSAGRTMRLVALADADLDGLPDRWELQRFGALGAAGFGTDADGDGFGDRAEWEAGTDPRDAASGLRLWVGQGGGGMGPRVSWSMQPDRYYTLEVSESGAAFRPMDGMEPMLNLGAARPGEMVLPPGGPGGPAIYRLRVDLP